MISLLIQSKHSLCGGNHIILTLVISFWIIQKVKCVSDVPEVVYSTQSSDGKLFTNKSHLPHATGINFRNSFSSTQNAFQQRHYQRKQLIGEVERKTYPRNGAVVFSNKSVNNQLKNEYRQQNRQEFAPKTLAEIVVNLSEPLKSAFLERRRSKAHIIAVPIDKKNVNTINKNVLVSNELNSKEQNTAEAMMAKKIFLLFDPQLTEKSVGINSWRSEKEVNSNDLRRTTMREMTSSTKSPPSSNNNAESESAWAFHQIPKYVQTKNVNYHINTLQLVSHETSETLDTNEQTVFKRPRIRNQISNLVNSSLTNTRLVQQSSLIDSAYQRLKNVLTNASEDKKQNYNQKIEEISKLIKKARILASQSKNANLKSTDILTKATTATTSTKILTRPLHLIANQVIEKVFSKPPRQKIYETLSKLNDGNRSTTLIPSKSIIDENDMDLLIPATKQTTWASPTLQYQPHPNPALYNNQLMHSYNFQSFQLPNTKLELCCRKQGLSPTCQTMCNFDTLTDQSLVNAVISNQCPGQQFGQAFDCVTSKVDHTECCQRANIHLYNGGQCMPFCQSHVPAPSNFFSHFSCLQVIDSIKSCYRNYQISHPNIFGD